VGEFDICLEVACFGRCVVAIFLNKVDCRCFVCDLFSIVELEKFNVTLILWLIVIVDDNGLFVRTGTFGLMNGLS